MRAASFCWQFQAPCNVFFLPLVGRGEQFLADGRSEAPFSRSRRRVKASWRDSTSFGAAVEM